MDKLNILFAVNQSSEHKFEQAILAKYKEKYNKEFTYEKAFYNLDILKSLDEKKYDVLLLSDMLEGSLTEPAFIDKLTDKYDVRVILVMDDSRRGSNFVKQIYAMGCYDCIFKEDFKLSVIFSLFETPRTKREAKEYYELDDNSFAKIDESISINELSEIPEEELKIVLENLNNSTSENIKELFNIAKKTYSVQQMTFLISLLRTSGNTKVIDLMKNNGCNIEKYEKILDREVEKVREIEKIVEKEVIKEVEKEVVKEVVKEVEVEKPIIIEKEVYKVTSFRYDAVITFVSANATGKTFLSWNLAHALSKNYKVAFVNIDSCSSANSYFGIDSEVIPFKNMDKKLLRDVVEEGYRVNKNLTVYTGEFGTRPYLRNDIYFKVLNQLRSENNIVIIDTASGYNDNLLTSLNYSSDIIFVYDLDNSHLKMNDRLLEKVEESISKNTIAVINNVYIGSKELVNVDKHLNGLNMFREVLNISNCGVTTYDYMFSNTCNYLKDKNDFTNDIDTLIAALRLEGTEKSRRSKVGLGKRIFNKLRRGK